MLLSELSDKLNGNCSVYELGVLMEETFRFFQDAIKDGVLQLDARFQQASADVFYGHKMLERYIT